MFGCEEGLVRFYISILQFRRRAKTQISFNGSPKDDDRKDRFMTATSFHPSSFHPTRWRAGIITYECYGYGLAIKLDLTARAINTICAQDTPLAG